MLLFWRLSPGRCWPMLQAGAVRPLPAVALICAAIAITMPRGG
jgi:hypothetical protein